jgi:hypothetical protein
MNFAVALVATIFACFRETIVLNAALDFACRISLLNKSERLCALAMSVAV